MSLDSELITALWSDDLLYQDHCDRRSRMPMHKKNF